MMHQADIEVVCHSQLCHFDLEIEIEIKPLNKKKKKKKKKRKNTEKKRLSLECSPPLRPLKRPFNALALFDNVI